MTDPTLGRLDTRLEHRLNRPEPITAAPVDSPQPIGGPIPLNAAQEQAAKDWAADDRLWTTQDTVAFNLRTFARVILQATDPVGRRDTAEAQMPDKRSDIMSPESILMADFVLAIDETGHALKLQPAMRAIERYKETLLLATADCKHKWETEAQDPDGDVNYCHECGALWHGDGTITLPKGVNPKS